MKKVITSLILNIIIAVSTLAVVISYFNGNTGTLISSGYESFKFFTTDSNILSAIAAVVIAVFDVQVLRGKRDTLPKAAVLLKYVGTVAVMVTFFTVMLFLGPLYGYVNVLGGTAFYMHLIGPLCALVSFCFFEKGRKITFKQSLLGILPTLIYGIVYLIQVVLLENWNDFYGFNIGGLWYISIVAMLIATFVICLLVKFLHNIGKNL